MGSIVRAGSAYGGWYYNPKLLPRGSTVISCGIGNDLTFDKHLIEQHDCHVVMVDPNQVALEAIANAALPEGKYTHIPAALWRDDDGVEFGAEFSNGAGVYSSGRKLRIGSISLDTLLARYPDTMLVKMDIEGAEFEVLSAWQRVVQPVQLLIGFHPTKCKCAVKEYVKLVSIFGYAIAHVEVEDVETVYLFTREV